MTNRLKRELQSLKDNMESALDSCTCEATRNLLCNLALEVDELVHSFDEFAEQQRRNRLRRLMERIGIAISLALDNLCE